MILGEPDGIWSGEWRAGTKRERERERERERDRERDREGGLTLKIISSNKFVQ